jgi:hypothetical protein
MMDTEGDVLIRDGEKVVDVYPKCLLDTYPHDPMGFAYSEWVIVVLMK